MTAPASKDMGVSGKIGPGLLVLVVGPSGAGKDTLMRIARRELADDPTVVFPRRVATREATAYEDNLTITLAEFERAVAADSFALSWQAHGHGYGLSHAIDGDIRGGLTVVANVSRTIVTEARERYRHTAVVLITAPPEVLAERLASRQRPSDGSIDERLQRASMESGLTPDATISNVGSAEEHGRVLADMIAARFKRKTEKRALDARGG
jgi:ribose 1,5-bisphosphokinase